MTVAEFQERLRTHFHPAAAGALDAVFELVIGNESLRFRVTRGVIDFNVPVQMRADATFRFEDEATAWALLSGRADPFDAFMRGHFRSDGYLMWAFALMSMFQPPTLPAVPGD